MAAVTFYIPCLFGLEGLVGDELRRLKLEDVRVENGHVLCRGGMDDLARLNLNLRCGERVLVLLGMFPATSFDALFEQTRALPWENWIDAQGAFPVKGYSLDSQLHSVPDCQKIIKKAIAMRLGAKYGAEHLPETGAAHQVQFALMHDRAALLLDTSGAGLHKRGYRAVGVAAPLRETLAAAMVLLSRYRGKDPLLRPLLRQRHHSHRSGADCEKPRAGAGAQLRGAEMGLRQRPELDGRGGGGHGPGI